MSYHIYRDGERKPQTVSVSARLAEPCWQSLGKQSCWKIQGNAFGMTQPSDDLPRGKNRSVPASVVPACNAGSREIYPRRGLASVIGNTPVLFPLPVLYAIQFVGSLTNHGGGLDFYNCS